MQTHALLRRRPQQVVSSLPWVGDNEAVSLSTESPLRQKPRRNHGVASLLQYSLLFSLVVFVLIHMDRWIGHKRRGLSTTITSTATIVSKGFVPLLRSETIPLHSFNLSGIPLSSLPHQVFPYYFLPPLTTRSETTDPFSLWNTKNGNNNNATKALPILHFVHTRFMQEQANLTALGTARLHLFEIFCLPTLVHQTTSNFLWLIRIDPDLDSTVFARLWQLIQEASMDNIYLVASNTNFRINEQFPGAWRDGAQSADLQKSRIYSGSLQRLTMALNAVHDVLILETRVDADDGLHIDYLRTIQSLAWQEFATPLPSQQGAHNNHYGKLQWKYWCAQRHLAWHWAAPSNASTWLNRHGAGIVTVARTNQMCITPGLTVAFPVGIREVDVPVFPHHQLVQIISQLSADQACGGDTSSDCVGFVQLHAFEAVRSRTPTSAGMLAVLANEGTNDDNDINNEAWVEYILWDILHKGFGISKDQLTWMQSFLTRHLLQIGQDNLRGQCTTGHSCKPEAKHDLERLVAMAASHIIE